MASYEHSKLFNEIAAALITPDFSNLPEFDSLALRVFHYQSKHNLLYRRFIDLLKIDIQTINSPEAIPFLPIGFFKDHVVKSGAWKAQQIFKSSGTGAMGRSAHHIRNIDWYNRNAKVTFEMRFGPLANAEIYALLPSYMEQGDSSLIHMVDYFRSMSARPDIPFYLHQPEALMPALLKPSANRKVLFGVTYALLDLAGQFNESLHDVTIIETGGMKGRREEITRPELHARLKKAFKIDAIFSEYGMTELMSQAYTDGQETFNPSPLMRVMVRDVTDPLSILPPGRQGAVNIIDLANLDTCSFIATDDLGICRMHHTFEISGRMDNSDIRGCSLLS